MTDQLKPHHLEALRAAHQHAADMPDKAWLHPRHLKGSKVADELTAQGLLERSVKPVKEWANGTERIFTYRITEAGKTVVQPPKKPRTPQELEDELEAAQQRNDALQRSLIEADAAREAEHAQALALAERLMEMEGQKPVTANPTPAKPPVYQPRAEYKILAELSIHDYPSLFALHDGEKMMAIELFSDKAITKKLVEQDGEYAMLTQRGKEVAAAVVEYVVGLFRAEELRALIEAYRNDKMRIDFISMKEMRMLDAAGSLTDFGRAVAAAAQVIEVGFTLADVTPAPVPNHVTHVDNMVIETLRAQLEAAIKDADLLRGELARADKLAIEKTREKRKADEHITALEKDVTALTEQRDHARTLADSYQREKQQAEATAKHWQTEHAKMLAAHNEANELLEAFTSQHADGHVIIRDANEQHLDRFTGEGRTILNISFNRDDDMILVVGPKPAAAPVQPERSTARTESPTQPRRPVMPPVQPPAPRPSVPAMPTAAPVQPTAIIPSAPPTNPQRVPTFMEIVEARASGQIDAAQFTRFANALAGYNASKKA